MKKLGKLIVGALSVATLATGAYVLYKKFIKKDTTDDFEDFEDDFEDFEDDEEIEIEVEPREYVSINITSDADASEEEQEDFLADETENDTQEEI